MKSDSLDDVLKAAQRSKTARTIVLASLVWTLKLIGGFGWALAIAIVLRVCAMPDRVEVADEVSVATSAANAATAGVLSEQEARRDDTKAIWRSLVVLEARRREPTSDKKAYSGSTARDHFDLCTNPADRFVAPRSPAQCFNDVLAITPER